MWFERSKKKLVASSETVEGFSFLKAEEFKTG